MTTPKKIPNLKTAIVKMAHYFLASITGLAFCGCQSYEDGMKLICDSPNRAPTVPQHSLVAAETLWISKNVKNEEALNFFKRLGDSPPKKRGAILKAETKRIGLEECPMVGFLDSWNASVEAIEEEQRRNSLKYQVNQADKPEELKP